MDSGWISRGIPAEWFTFYLMLFAWGSSPVVTGKRRLPVSGGVTARLLAEAKLSLQLAQARYRPGLSSIVELSQA